MKFLEWLASAVLVVMIFGVVVARIFTITTFPSGIYVDEGSVGYNAYTLWYQGTDEFGVPWPVYFRAFGEFKNPIYIYVTAAFFWLFGVSTWTLRLPAAFALLLAAGVLATLVASQKRTWKARFWVAGLSFLLFVLQPWTLLFGRVAFEIAVFPLVFFSLIFAVVRLDREPAVLRWWVLAGMLCGLLFYTYTIARLLAPVSFLLLLLLYAKRSHFFEWLAGGMSFALLLIPVAIWEWYYPGALLARYHVIAAHPSFTQWASGFLSHFSPLFLFVQGDQIYRHHILGFGPVTLFLLPLVLLGVLSVSSVYSKKVLAWSVLAAFVSLIPASLAQPTPHVLRSVALLCLISFWGSVGVSVMWHKLHTQIWLVGVSLVIMVEALLVWNVFFSAQYQRESAEWFEYSVTESLHYINKNHSNKMLYVSNRLYAGTSVTVNFLRAVYTLESPSEVQKMSLVVDVNLVTDDLPSGSLLLLSGQECRSSDVEKLFESNDACVVEK